MLRCVFRSVRCYIFSCLIPSDPQSSLSIRPDPTNQKPRKGRMTRAKGNCRQPSFNTRGAQTQKSKHTHTHTTDMSRQKQHSSQSSLKHKGIPLYICRYARVCSSACAECIASMCSKPFLSLRWDLRHTVTCCGSES